MSRIYLAAILIPALCLGLPSNAIAKIPDPNNCDVPDHIVLVAQGADGTADPFGTFTILVRNLAGDPQQSSSVVLYFRDCPDVRICTNQSPDLMVYCEGRSVRGFTGPDGRVTFRVVGCANNLGASPGAVAPGVDVYADGVFLRTISAAVLDQDGGGGLDGADLSLFLADYFSGQPFSRSDFDGDGTLSGNDLSVWHAAFFAGGSARSGTPSCP